MGLIRVRPFPTLRFVPLGCSCPSGLARSSASQGHRLLGPRHSVLLSKQEPDSISRHCRAETVSVQEGSTKKKEALHARATHSVSRPLSFCVDFTCDSSCSRE